MARGSAVLRARRTPASAPPSAQGRALPPCSTGRTSRRTCGSRHRRSPRRRARRTPTRRWTGSQRKRPPSRHRDILSARRLDSRTVRLMARRPASARRRGSWWDPRSWRHQLARARMSEPAGSAHTCRMQTFFIYRGSLLWTQDPRVGAGTGLIVAGLAVGTCEESKRWRRRTRLRARSSLVVCAGRTSII